MTLLIALSVAATLAQVPSAPATGSVSGIVLEDGTGTPIEGAQVTVMPMRSSPVAFPMSEPPLSVSTDQNGRFAIRGLEPGRYRVAVQKSGYAMPFAPGAATSIDLAAGEEGAVSLSLQRGAAIVGRVVNEAGEPVINVRVMAMRQAPVAPRDSSPARVRSVAAGPGAQTNDLGEFRVFGLPAGEYYVQASPGPEFGRGLNPRARTMVPTFFPDVTDPDSARTITVAPGQTSDAIVIRMLEAPAFQVSGIVVDESGQPVANAMVRLDTDPATGPSFFGRFLQARTNATGAFTITNVTTATYLLVAIPPVVTSGSGDSRVSVGGSTVAFSSGSGAATGGIISESRDGVVTQYRDEFATKAQLTVNQGDINGLQVIVRLPR
jgi:hypothetical protein